MKTDLLGPPQLWGRGGLKRCTSQKFPGVLQLWS